MPWTVATSDRGDPVDELNFHPTDEEMQRNVIRLVFQGDEARFREFCGIVRESVPEANAGVLRGSAVTGFRWKDEQPFDADGPGTSDLDLTLVGADVLR